VRDAATLARIRTLAIPPAWTDVWISPDPEAHLQATGRDAKGRKQYRYHPKWREMRDREKYSRLVEFCRALPKLRKAVARDLSCKCLCKQKVVATVVALMERAQLRVGNDEYARTNGSYGATTLRDRHAKVKGDTIELSYNGKSGIARRVKLSDRKLARIVRSCRDLPGQRLFQYLDGDDTRAITSTDVNDYIHEIAGEEFTAKDYRTWAGTLGAAMLLCGVDHPGNVHGCKQCIKHVVNEVAEQLGHTPAVCRASYIHPQLLEDFSSDQLRDLATQIKRSGPIAFDVDRLRAVEKIVASYLSAARSRSRSRPADEPARARGRRRRSRSASNPRRGRSASRHGR
jgi:DNA topoisomerase-1